MTGAAGRRPASSRCGCPGRPPTSGCSPRCWPTTPDPASTCSSGPPVPEPPGSRGAGVPDIADRERRPDLNTEGQITIRQWFALPKAERRARAEAFREADEALQANGDAEQAAGIDWETDEYDRLNRRVNDLWPTVPWSVRDPALPHVAADIARLARREADHLGDDDEFWVDMPRSPRIARAHTTSVPSQPLRQQAA